MTYWFKFILVFFAFVVPARAGAEDASMAAGATAAVAANSFSDSVGRSSIANAASDCDCPKLTCNFECEYEQSVTFYSEKCSAGTKVRSCARPTCLPLPNAPMNCASAKKENAEGDRGIASEKKKAEDAAATSKYVAEVSDLEGQAWVIVSELEKSPLTKGHKLRETDRVATGDKSKLEISFSDGNVLTLTPNSILELSKINFDEDIQKRNTLLNLLKGRVRSKVKQKYAGTPQSYFKVKTRAAVAGVRGTDFIVTLDQINDDLTTKVETLSGEVELASPLKEHKAVIGKSQTATYIAKGLARVGAVSEEIEADFASRGRMTPVMSLKEAQLATLEKDTALRFAAKKVPNKAINERICSQPEAQFNQCSWTCENNPNGEKRCRTDLPYVNCIRRVCNANGSWTDAMRLPAAFADQCDPAKVIVGPCDY